MNYYKQVEVIRSKFSKKQMKKLIQFGSMVHWNQPASEICQEIKQMDQQNGKYIWMVGVNPTYFIQYQVDSYAILKIYEKYIIIWKPKYLQYPSIYHLSAFPQDLKPPMKAFSLKIEENHGPLSQNLCSQIETFLSNYYASQFFRLPEQQFETNLVTQMKHWVSKASGVSYWHVVFDEHGKVNVSVRGSLYLKVRIQGAKDKYDKDLIIFSHQGVRQFFLKGKKIQALSFLAMLVIFLAVISCTGDEQEGFCMYKNEMMIGGAAVMMGLMGLRVATRASNKRKLEQKLKST